MNVDTHSATKLLARVEGINKKYLHLARITGGNFNIFSILRKKRDELTHSRFLAELLDPKGQHGQGAIYLRSFIETIGLEGYNDERLEDYTVHKEYHMGPIPQDYSQGGFIDIFIRSKNGNKDIVIENKIDAIDQPKQLVRLYAKNQNAKIYYLTLTGRPPDGSSILDEQRKIILEEGKHFGCISYVDAILTWLHSCYSLSISLPVVRETIAQYISIVKELSGKIPSESMNEEIKSTILTSKDAFHAAADISKAFAEVNIKIENKFDSELRSKEVSRFLRNWNGFKIYFDLEVDNDGYYFGFRAKSALDEQVKNTDVALRPLTGILLRMNSSFTTNQNYFGWVYPDQRIDFRTMELDMLYQLSDNNFRYEFISNLVDQATRYVDGFLANITEEAESR